MALPLIDHGLRLSVHQLATQGRAGRRRWSGVSNWTRDGERIARIGFHVELHGESSGRLTLDYVCNGVPVQCSFRIFGEACRFGGVRWFATCPQTGRRASKLYHLPGTSRFCGRTAYRTAYRSQRDPAGFSRLCARRNRLLFGKLQCSDPDFIPKPKWMRWPTYDRLVSEVDRLHSRMDTALIRRFGTLSFNL